MNRSTLLALLLSALPGPVLAQEPAGCPAGETLEWMVGRWRSEVESTVFLEAWTRDADGILHGRAQSHKADGTEIFLNETMFITWRDEGLVYAVDPENDGVFIEFVASECGPDSVKFDNPDNEFPKRIEYRRNEQGELSAHLTDMGKQGFDLYFVVHDGS